MIKVLSILAPIAVAYGHDSHFHFKEGYFFSSGEYNRGYYILEKYLQIFIYGFQNLVIIKMVNMVFV